MARDERPAARSSLDGHKFAVVDRWTTHLAWGSVLGMTVSFDVTDKITAKARSGAWYEVHLVPTALIPKWNWMRRPAGKLETLGALLGLVWRRAWHWLRRRPGWSVLVLRAAEFPTDVPISDRGAILARADFATRAIAARHAEDVRQSIAAGDFHAQ